jgi:hypothetical protein
MWQAIPATWRPVLAAPPGRTTVAQPGAMEPLRAVADGSTSASSDGRHRLEGNRHASPAGVQQGEWPGARVEGRVRVRVRLASSAVTCRPVQRVPWPEFLRAGPGSRAWSSAAAGCCVAARPARRVRVGLPGLVTSAVTGSMAAVQALLRTACRLVIEVVPEPEEHPVQHFLSQFPCARVLLPQLNVSTPKTKSRAPGSPWPRPWRVR